MTCFKLIPKMPNVNPAPIRNNFMVCDVTNSKNEIKLYKLLMSKISAFLKNQIESDNIW